MVLASSKLDELSLVPDGMKNSLFTHHLLAALRGDARTRGDGKIRVLDVFDYLSENVSARHPQHPVLAAQDLEKNFPICLYLAGKQVRRRPPETRLGDSPVNRTDLRQKISASFSVEDLRVLCRELEEELQADRVPDIDSLEWDGLAANGKEGRTAELIEYLKRRGALGYLVARVRRKRPGLL